ncbi:MAG: hypothetical protein CMC38_04185 [Flavobacteriaceae bacterium]|nr:hypothetical protein [Flavobacteriaceae bacterium]|tara:strand:- start:1764 stop:2276 length:513 start_codon:yes stop_codon:yes gene_type:complete
MEDITTKKCMLEYGTWTGITLISFAIMLFFLEAHYENSTSTQIINTLIQFSGITIACLAYKKANSSKISWGETRKIGTGVSLIIAIIAVIYTYLLANIIEPGYMDKVLEISYYETLENYPEALANMKLNQYIENAKPFTWFTYPAILFFTIFFGFLYSLILGFFIKTKNT